MPVLAHVAWVPWQTPADVQRSLIVLTLLSLHAALRLLGTWQKAKPWQTPADVQTSLNVLALLSLQAAPRLLGTEQNDTQQVAVLQVEPAGKQR
jgi:hypothetical protein